MNPSDLNVNGYRRQVAAQLVAITAFMAADEFQAEASGLRRAYAERVTMLVSLLLLIDEIALAPPTIPTTV